MNNKPHKPTWVNDVLIVTIAVLVMLLILIIGHLVDTVNQSKNQQYTPSSSSSSSTDWDAYCRDLFPDSPSARQSCKNGANVMTDLMDGKYDR